MIDIVVQEFSQEEWNKTVSSFEDLSLMQTWEYAEAKAKDTSWKVERLTFMDGGRVVGAAQAMVRFVPTRRSGLVWISRGPLWRSEISSTPATGVALLDALRRHWVTERGMYLRVLPTFLESEVPAGSFTQINYQPAEGSVHWSSARIDLTQPEETLRARLQQKWRNGLNKSERQAISIETGTSESLFNELLAEYERMLDRKAFGSVVTPDLLRRLQQILPDDRKLWSVVARQREQRLGAVLIARYGQACEYFVGAINDAGKALNAGQLLLWQAICQMKEKRVRWFDVGGTDPKITPKGILHFKNGLGGLPYTLNHEIEAFDTGLVTRAIRWRVTRERQLT